MEERKWVVYIHGVMCDKGYIKRYVGITKQKVNKRWRNGKGYVDSKYFYRAIQKYGWDNFDHEIIASNLTKQEAENLEILLIRQFKSNIRKYGYNIENGGNVKGTHSKETIEKIKNAISGENHYLYGKHPSDETRKKMSESRMLGNNPKAKCVICDGIKFSCCKECANYYGASYSSMKQWLNGRNKMPVEWYVLGLRYTDISMSKYIREDKEHWSIGNGVQNGSTSKAVEVFKDGESIGIFPSASEIERVSIEVFNVKLSTSCISRVCSGERKYHNGFTFKFVGE